MPNPNTRPTMDMVLSRIKSVVYVRMPSGTTIICEVTLKNQHTCHGKATVVDMDNDDVERGKKTAYDKAIAEVFEHVAYELHTKMMTDEIPNCHIDLVNVFQHANNGRPVLLEPEVI